MVKQDYNISTKPITVRNPQANAIVERVHQTMGNMIRTFMLQEMSNPHEAIPGIFAAIAFGICSTIHTTTRATPMQLVFGRDSILNVQHLADWRYIQYQKQNLINKNTMRENKSRWPYEYQVNDEVMVKMDQTSKYGTNAYKGPYKVSKINDNGTVHLEMGNIVDTYNIRNIKPYRR